MDTTCKFCAEAAGHRPGCPEVAGKSLVVTSPWGAGHHNSLTRAMQDAQERKAGYFGEFVQDPANDPERRLFPIPTKEAAAKALLQQQTRKEEDALNKARASILASIAKREDEAFTTGKLRTFSTGATRDTDEGKNDYEGFLSPLVLREFGDYMTEHRVQSDGSLRDSDNWQKGIEKDAYMKSLLRHVFDLWLLHRGYEAKPERRGGKFQTPTKRSLLCSIMFNTMGYLHELLREALTKPEAA